MNLFVCLFFHNEVLDVEEEEEEEEEGEEERDGEDALEEELEEDDGDPGQYNIEYVEVRVIVK